MFSLAPSPTHVVRAIEVVRHQLGQLHRRMVPPQAAMMELITNGWAAQAITAAADLGIADALANGPLSADELATAVDAEADTVRRLLRALIGRGVFRQLRDGRYDLTPLADTLIGAGARERTPAQYDLLLSRAGFRMTRVVATASPISVVEAVAI
jgi:Dimerisation domain